MYLYETYNDPIQMISGDAYADIGAVKPHYTIPVKEEEPKPKPKLKKTTKKRESKPQPEPREYQIIRQYLTTMGMYWVVQKTGLTADQILYRAKKIGFSFIGGRGNPNGYWELSGNPWAAYAGDPESPKVKPTRRKKLDMFPDANEKIQNYLLTRGIAWVAIQIGMSRQCTCRRANRLGYRYIGNHMRSGHWEAPKEERQAV